MQTSGQTVNTLISALVAFVGTVYVFKERDRLIEDTVKSSKWITSLLGLKRMPPAISKYITRPILWILIVGLFFAGLVLTLRLVGVLKGLQ